MSPPDLDRITDTPMIAAYLGVLKEKNIGPDGIAQKLDTVTTALVFYMQACQHDWSCEATLEKVQKAEECKELPASRREQQVSPVFRSHKWTGNI